jgi:hypothetical protein
MEIENIYNMDCLEGMKQIPDGTIDLVVTDCPYKICSGGCTKAVPEYAECGGILTHRKTEKRTDWVDDVRTGKMFQDNEIAFDEWLPVIYAKLKEQAHCYIMVNSRNLKELQQKAEDAGFKFHTAAMSKRYNKFGWWFILALSALTAAGGYWMLKFTPSDILGISILLGITLAIDGVSNIFSAFYLASCEKSEEARIYLKAQEELAVDTSEENSEASIEEEPESQNETEENAVCNEKE